MEYIFHSQDMQLALLTQVSVQCEELFSYCAMSVIRYCTFDGLSGHLNTFSLIFVMRMVSRFTTGQY